jgi:hypothetical protein
MRAPSPRFGGRGRRARSGEELCADFLGDGDDLFGRIVIADHGGPGEGNGLRLFFDLLFQLIVYFESHAGKFGGGYGGKDNVAVENLAFEFDSHIGHDKAGPGEVDLAVTMMAEELDANLVDEGKDGIIADVTGVVQVGDANGDGYCKRETIG